MILKVVIYIQILFFLSSCHGFSQEVETVEGVVKFTFVKDTIGYERYWLIKKELNEHSFVEDIVNIAVNIDLICGETKIKVPENRRTFYDFEEYENRSLKNNDVYNHYGGEVFINSFGHIIISFYIVANVIKLERLPCEGFHLQSSYSCPVEREKMNFPVLIMTDILKVEKLDMTYLKKERLLPYSKAFFPVGKCD